MSLSVGVEGGFSENEILFDEKRLKCASLFRLLSSSNYRLLLFYIS
jgi:hypothetical protein